MARRQAIDPDELFETANRLEADGKEVTAVALLDALGGGSLRTIYKYMDVWREKRPAVQKTPTANEVPERVQAGFVTAWRLATQEAAIEIEAVKQKAVKDIEEANKQFQDTLDAVDKLEKEAEASADQIEALTAQVTNLQEDVRKLALENASRKATADELSTQLAKIENSARLDRAERDAAIKESAELRGLVGSLKEQNSILIDKLSTGEKADKKR